MSYVTYPNNPFPPSSENSGGGGEHYTLPIASTETLGGVKVGDNLTVEEDGTLNADSKSVNYSTTEQPTGQKWIDGKDIYTITVNFGALPNNSTKAVSCPLNIAHLLDIKCATANNRILPYVYVSDNYSEFIGVAYSANDEIVISTNQDFSSDSAYVTLYYTKSETEE